MTRLFRPLFLAADAVRRRRQPLGRTGEDLAHRYLESRGLIVVARNYRTPGGSAEVDLIARDGPLLVFVEVKTRQSEDVSAPERNIGEEKRDKIRRAARHYLRRSGHDPALVRYDIVAIVMTPRREIRHHPDAWL